jgi:hypothetical protein
MPNLGTKYLEKCELLTRPLGTEYLLVRKSIWDNIWGYFFQIYDFGTFVLKIGSLYKFAPANFFDGILIGKSLKTLSLFQ